MQKLSMTAALEKVNAAYGKPIRQSGTGNGACRAAGAGAPGAAGAGASGGD